MRRQQHPPVLSANLSPTCLPAAGTALDDPPGLVAIGGALSPDWLRHAYRHGLFPWFAPGDPILWWSPAQRMVFRPEALRVTRSLRQSVRNRGYLIGIDGCFERVMQACATRGRAHQATDSKNNSPPDIHPHQDLDATWIVPEMTTAYAALHHQGDAHSIEVWLGDDLVGGLYGVSLGGVFWGESMFSRGRDASKVALLALAGECRRRGIGLIDAQFHTPHLASLGGFEMPRAAFLAEIALRVRQETATANWRRAPEPACKVV